LVNTTGDGEHSPPLDFELIRELRLSEDVPVKDSDFLFGCSCPASGCTDPTVCDCVKDQIPQQFAYKNGVIIAGFDNQNVIYECNSKCACTIECGNRVVERGRQVELQLFRTQNKGWGGSPHSIDIPQNLRNNESDWAGIPLTHWSRRPKVTLWVCRIEV
jgi:hypothetical protein